MEQRTGALHMEIRADSDDAHHAILDLYRWLEQDSDVRDHAVLKLRSPHLDDGTMGAVEVIDLVIGQGVAVTNLALSYTAWRTARPMAPGITITANGRTVTLPASCDAEMVRRIVEAVDTASPETSRTADADGPRQPHSEPGSE